MHRALEKRRDRRIDQAVTLEPRAATERLGHEGHAVVTAGAASLVTGVRGAVIEDLECRGRERLLERAAQLRHDLRAHRDTSEAGARAGSAAAARLNHSTCSATNAKVSTAKPNNLKYTQVRSLAPYATARLSAPSSA